MGTFVLLNKSRSDIFFLLLCKSDDVTLGTTYLCRTSAYISETIPQKCFYKKALQDSTHAKVWFQ